MCTTASNKLRFSRLVYQIQSINVYFFTFIPEVVSTPPPPDALGSCVSAGYNNCCTFGYCVGSPPTCSCDADCYVRGDCCPDINATGCIAGSCAAAGYRACCTDVDCEGTRGCYCDQICTLFGDCCFDFEDLCPRDSSSVIGSCAASGYETCCDNGSDCLGSPANCKCDSECRDHGDCCADISATCPLTRKNLHILRGYDESVAQKLLLSMSCFQTSTIYKDLNTHNIILYSCDLSLLNFPYSSIW